MPFTGITRKRDFVLKISWDGGHIRCTAGHRFITGSGAQFPAEALVVGDSIVSKGGRVKITDIVNDGEDFVYDAGNVANVNLYYTGGVLSHN